MGDRYDDRLVDALRAANGTGPPVDASTLTFGDVLAIQFCGDDVVYVCPDCSDGHHQICLGGNGGRTCMCADDRPHPFRRRS